MYSLRAVSRPLASVCSAKLASVRFPASVSYRVRVVSSTSILAKSSEQSTDHTMVRDNIQAAATEDKQDRAAEMVVDAAHEKVQKH